MARPSVKPGGRDGADQRKLIAFDRETFQALDLLARDRMSTFQELADEAFGDLLNKHRRPTDLKAALRDSARTIAANENRKRTRSRRS